MNWEQQLQAIFASKQPQTAEELARAERISRAVITRVRQRAAIKLAIFIAGFVISGLLAVYFGSVAISEAADNGLLDVLRLVASDLSTVVQQWQAFTLSLVELLPAISVAGALTALLGMVITFAYSLQTYGKYHQVKSV